MASAVAFKGFPLAGRLMELPAAPTAGTGKPIATAVRLLNVKRDAADDDDSDDASSVLKVTLPKTKDEDRKDVFQIKVE